MTGTARRHTMANGLRWLAVVLGCVVSLTAPFDMDTVAQVLRPGSTTHHPVAIVADLEDNDPDQDNLLAPGSPAKCRRADRKQPRPLEAVPPAETSPIFRWAPSLPTLGWLVSRPGGEHAFRNGCGTPLLC